MLANRCNELKCCCRITDDYAPKRIVFLKGESGYGKTELLENVIQSSPSEIIKIPIDLKGAESGIWYFYNKICEELLGEKFTEFMNNFPWQEASMVNVENNKLIGRNNYISINSDDKNQLNSRHLRDKDLNILRKYCFRSLDGINERILFIIDCFEKAPHELKFEININFLKKVINDSNLTVIVAGRQTPSKSIEISGLDKHSLKVFLDKITDPNEWFQYTQDKGLSLTIDEVKSIVRNCDGIPCDIVNDINKYMII